MALCALALALLCLSDPHQTALYILDIFTLPILTMTVIMTVGLLIARQRAAFAIGLLATVLLLVAVWPQAVIRPLPASAAATPLRIVFANIYFRNPHPERLRTFAESQKADIVVTVETTPRIWERLQVAFADYPYRSKQGEVAIFSRLPFAQAPVHDGGHIAHVRFDTPAGPMRLVAAHLDHPDSHRQPKQPSLQDRLRQVLTTTGSDDTVLVGDFNSDMSGYWLKGLAHDFRLKALAAPFGTWPSILPGILRLNLDNGFAGRHYSLSGRVVGPLDGSDHRPIAFEVRRAA
ncbi:endonuclease/exonuclease/phosphatase family protein [Asticcacaulis sp. EMRT-3]|uniref:endonuclease/exonuclease/phosphatase family protein n=1 Tax=Asticcacaulis sp. EMRT-3 TaxID=3040349 RepID=UPI0024AED94A|nr:endonuclease/exonuclease/phosphatase family protein [Asticcacaulis sp. EMRT-3]MDI7774987.1 hypothetical protein [Asticcacaulis sp. EMRT-3]